MKMVKWDFENLDQNKGKNVGRRKQSNLKKLFYSGLVAWTLLTWAVSCQDAWKSKNNDRFNEKTEIKRKGTDIEYDSIEKANTLKQFFVLYDTIDNKSLWDKWYKVTNSFTNETEEEQKKIKSFCYSMHEMVKKYEVPSFLNKWDNTSSAKQYRISLKHVFFDDYKGVGGMFNSFYLGYDEWTWDFFIGDENNVMYKQSIHDVELLISLIFDTYQNAQQVLDEYIWE